MESAWEQECAHFGIFPSLSLWAEVPKLPALFWETFHPLWLPWCSWKDPHSKPHSAVA